MSALPGAPLTAPRIGLTAVVRTWDGAERTGVNAAYVRAVLVAGGAPVLLSPLVGACHAATLVDGIDGLLLSGGEDVDPTLYGAVPSPHLQTVSRERDLFELAVFAVARERGLPILGVCRGIQLIAVGLGGTLYQDLASERPSDVRHDPGTARDARVHDVRLAPDSRVAAALGIKLGATSLQVNSLHHQAIKDLPPALRATGWADDGLIEAVESAPDAGWLLAVQWHPEEMHADRQAPDGGLFRAFIDAAAAAQARDTASRAAPGADRQSVHAEIAQRAVR